MIIVFDYHMSISNQHLMIKASIFISYILSCEKIHVNMYLYSFRVSIPTCL